MKTWLDFIFLPKPRQLWLRFQDSHPMQSNVLFSCRKRKAHCLQDVRAAWDGAVRSPKGRMSQREALARLSQRRGGDGRAERARSACQGVRS